MALPGRGGGMREARGASSEEDWDDDDDDSSSEEVDARDCVRVGCVSFEATDCLEIIEARFTAASGTSADAETLARVRE